MNVRTYVVMVPIAGHAEVVVEAATEEEAIDKAIDECSLDHIQEWEALRRFNQGNVCYCPTPWEAEAVDETPDDEESKS